MNQYSVLRCNQSGSGHLFRNQSVSILLCNQSGLLISSATNQVMFSAATNQIRFCSSLQLKFRLCNLFWTWPGSVHLGCNQPGYITSVAIKSYGWITLNTLFRKTFEENCCKYYFFKQSHFLFFAMIFCGSILYTVFCNYKPKKYCLILPSFSTH